MTSKEAIRFLQLQRAFANESSTKIEAIDTAIKALEKQEPKKVIQHGKEGDDLCWFGCPMCGFYLTGYWKDEILCYCSECGQKLDWSEENE